MSAHKEANSAQYLEVKPKTGQTGGMGRSYAPPKTYERGAYENNVKRRTTIINTPGMAMNTSLKEAIRKDNQSPSKEGIPNNYAYSRNQSGTEC